MIIETFDTLLDWIWIPCTFHHFVFVFQQEVARERSSLRRTSVCWPWPSSSWPPCQTGSSSRPPPPRQTTQRPTASSSQTAAAQSVSTCDYLWIFLLRSKYFLCIKYFFFIFHNIFFVLGADCCSASEDLGVESMADDQSVDFEFNFEEACQRWGKVFPNQRVHNPTHLCFNRTCGTITRARFKLSKTNVSRGTVSLIFHATLILTHSASTTWDYKINSWDGCFARVWISISLYL